MLDSGSKMEIVQLIIGIIVIVSLKFIIIKIIYNRIRISKLTREELRFDSIRPIYKKLKLGETPKISIIEKYANSLESRTLTYNLLNKFNKAELFPKELLTIEKFSESYLANWLNMNDDFDNFPDEIVFENKMELKNEITILVFKFKTYEPHIFAEKDWLKGYIGYKSSEINSFKDPEINMSNFSNENLTDSDLEKTIELQKLPANS